MRDEEDEGVEMAETETPRGRSGGRPRLVAGTPSSSERRFSQAAHLPTTPIAEKRARTLSDNVALASKLDATLMFKEEHGIGKRDHVRVVKKLVYVYPHRRASPVATSSGPTNADHIIPPDWQD